MRFGHSMGFWVPEITTFKTGFKVEAFENSIIIVYM